MPLYSMHAGGTAHDFYNILFVQRKVRCKSIKIESVGCRNGREADLVACLFCLANFGRRQRDGNVIRQALFN